MSDNLTARLSVGVIYSGDGSGLTPEQEEQLNKIPIIEQSVGEITNDLNSKANTSDIPTAIQTYVTTHRDEWKGDTGAAGRDGTNAVNPNFTIGTVTTLGPNESATVTLSGTYPNLVLNFGIPRGAGQTVDTTEYMYYGRLSIEDVGGRVIPLILISMPLAPDVSSSKVTFPPIPLSLVTAYPLEAGTATTI